MQKTKTKQIQEHIANGDYKRAIAVCSRFYDKSPCTQACKLAQSAILSPAFFRQMGKDPFVLQDNAIKLLRDKFGGDNDK